MKYQAVLFDLDGTLLDTLPDIADASNQVLRDHGFPERTPDDYLRYIGEGVHRLFARAVPPGTPEEEAEACAADFFDAYQQCWNHKTKPFSGILETLRALSDRGLRLAVLSNKPHAFTQKCVREYFSDFSIEPVLGQREGLPRKPDPAPALEVASTLKLAPDEVLYVGDSGVDMQTAVRAGMMAIGVGWGYRPAEELKEQGADRIIETPAELLDIVG